MRTDYFFKLIPFPQMPDSAQSNSSFMQQNNGGFMGQQSIMSAEFEDNSVDSLVKVKTRRLRPRKKKLDVKSYKYLDSYLIVKKDSFAFLENIKTNSFSTVDFDKFISKSDTSTIVYYKTIDAELQDSLSIDSIPGCMSIPLVKNALSSDYNIAYFSEMPFENINTVENEDTIEFVNLSVKEEHTTAPVNNTAQEDHANTYKLSGESWLMFILLSVLLLFAFVRMHFNSKLRTYTQSVISYQSFNKMYKEQNTVNLRLGFLLSFIYNISISLIIYYSATNYFIVNNLPSGFILFLIIFGIVIAFTLFFISINKLLAFFFEQSNLLNEIVYNFLFANRFFGLLLLPTALSYPYLPELFAKILLFSAWGIIVFSFIFRWFRGIIISFKFRVSYLYMILYLCILEIIPLIFFVKEILSLY